MKFFKIIIILILISPANANTIFYLIKIPNLEIYNDKSDNGLKYLKATRPFEVGIRNNNVSCFNSSEKLLEKKFRNIESNLKIYSSDFLNKINLKYVVLCERLSVAEIQAAGVPNNRVKTLIINIKFNEDYFERVLHHEVFHMINESYKDLFLDSEWMSFNNSDFNYAECSTCSDRLNLSLRKKKDGFLTEYAMSTPSEDMAEVYSFLIINNNRIESMSLKDPILRKKISYIKKKILKIDKNFIF